MLKRFIALSISATIATTPISAWPTPITNGVGEYNLPSLGAVAGAELSELQERQLGETLMQRVRADPSYLNDIETADYLNRLGLRLVTAADPSPYNFYFFPLRDKTLNAFALPGGFIGVHSGLVVNAQTESELASVISHEIGHVTQRHIARMIEQSKGSLAMTLGSILLAILAARAGGNSGGDAAMGILMGSQAAMISQQLGYSRDAEREADRVGLTTLTNAGFDPMGMQDFFSRLRKNNRWYESVNTKYLSTHPLTNERMSDMQNRTRLLQPHPIEDSLDFLLIQARLKVVQETTYDGWRQALSTFNHALQTETNTQRQIALHYGKGVALSRLNQKSEALQSVKKASTLLTSENVIIDKLLAELSFELAQTTTEKQNAIAISKSVYDRYPYSQLAILSYTEILYQAGQHENLIRFMRKQDTLTRKDPDYYAILARSYEATNQQALAFLSTGRMYSLMGNWQAAVYQLEKAQKSADADFYTLSEIDALLKEARQKVLDEKGQF